MNNYTILHCHSDMSNGVTNIDSVTKYQQYVERAKELGMKALAISEHGCVFDWYGKKEAIENAGMKYIHAEEFYVTQEITKDEDGQLIRVRDNWHCLLMAKNLDGVKEINRLASKSFNRRDGHYYYEPRIEFKDLINTSDNIIISTACLGGILNKAPDDIQKIFLEFMSSHKDRCFLEIQHHNVSDQIRYNQKLYQLGRKYGLKLVACTDTHSLNAKHALGRKILQQGKDISFANEDGWDLTFKSYDELVDAYRKQGSLPENVYLEAIENTNHIADMVETFAIDRCTKYPHIYDNPLKTFKHKINEGYKRNKYLQERYDFDTVANRLKEEVEVYNKVGAIDFMLLEAYIREWEAQNDVQCGPGRGSVSGSLVAYVLGITQMDSLKFNLNFFRFMNPARVTNADIDTDYCSRDRDKLKYFLLHDKLDLPNIKTSEIITFNTIAMKGTIRDVCKALYGPSKGETVSRIPKYNNKTYLELAAEIAGAVFLDEKNQWTIGREWREKYPEIFEYVDIVSGTIVSIGSHPSGVLVSDRDIESEVGMCSIAGSDYPVSMLDMHGLDEQMYVKLDVLGLDNVGVINDTCRLVGIERLTPDNIDLNDDKVWEDICKDTTLIFQWESDSAQAFLKKFMSPETIEKAKKNTPNFSYLKWFSFGNGLLRPACASYRDQVANGEFYDNGFKELNDFLAPEAGRVCMQETIMMFLVKFCGYSQAESDSVRRAIAKKKGTATLLPEIEQRFIDYSSTHYDITKDKCREVIKPFLQIVLDASDYGFSWNHSDAYSCIGYISGYLRYYYKLEFLTSAFNVFAGKMEKIATITKYANKNGIKINPIKFRHSRADYSMEKETNSIYKGIASIKYMNAEVAEQLYNMRNDKFDSFIDLLKVFPGNSKQREILISLNFFEEFGKTKKLLKLCELYDKFHSIKRASKEKLKNVPVELVKECMLKETEKQYVFDESGARLLLTRLADMVPNTELPLQTRLENQEEYLGYIETILPDKDRFGVIFATNTKYTPKLTIYNLWNGEMVTCKLNAKTFQESPVQKGDIIEYTTFEKPAWTKDEKGNWVADENRKELWIRSYAQRTI